MVEDAQVHTGHMELLPQSHYHAPGLISLWVCVMEVSLQYTSHSWTCGCISLHLMLPIATTTSVC